MIKDQDLTKLENLKGELEKAESNDIQEDCIVEPWDQEVAQPKEDKPKKTTRSKKPQLTKEEIQEMLDDHLAKVKELVEHIQNKVCYRVYNGVNVALSRHLGGNP